MLRQCASAHAPVLLKQSCSALARRLRGSWMKWPHGQAWEHAFDEWVAKARGLCCVYESRACTSGVMLTADCTTWRWRLMSMWRTGGSAATAAVRRMPCSRRITASSPKYLATNVWPLSDDVMRTRQLLLPRYTFASDSMLHAQRRVRSSAAALGSEPTSTSKAWRAGFRSSWGCPGGTALLASMSIQTWPREAAPE